MKEDIGIGFVRSADASDAGGKAIFRRRHLLGCYEESKIRTAWLNISSGLCTRMFNRSRKGWCLVL